MKIFTYDITKSNIPQNLNQNLLIMGDMHGNIKKLVDALIFSGFIETNESKYLEFFKDLDFLENHNNIKFENYFDFKESKAELILLGDCFADRNFFDLIKLNLLTKIDDNKNKFTILFGNHDSAAFSLINKKKANCSPINKEFYKIHYNNKYNILKIRKDFLNLILNHYKLFYFLEDKKIFLSHAPINQNDFNSFINFYEIKNKSINEIVKFANDYFYDLILKNYHNDIFLESFVWNRFQGEDNHICCRNDINLQISGHDLFNQGKKIISLDNYNGKIKEQNFPENILAL